jgi:hypothetical protein
MRPSRLLLSFVMLISFVVIGCGDDGGSTQPDAKVFEDAPPPDAPPAQMASMGLGKVCDQANPCPATVPICATVGTVGFCTQICGNTPEAAMEPPADGNMICQNLTPASPSATPGCVLTAPPMGGTKDWACGLVCGMIEGNDLGPCPLGLTCTDNLCQ